MTRHCSNQKGYLYVTNELGADDTTIGLDDSTTAALDAGGATVS